MVDSGKRERDLQGSESAVIGFARSMHPPRMVLVNFCEITINAGVWQNSPPVGGAGRDWVGGVCPEARAQHVMRLAR